jgi:hypothetical protein
MSNLKEKIKAAQIDLITELGIDKLEQEQKEKIIMDVGEIIQQRIITRVVEELPEDKKDEFQGLLEKAQDNPEALDEFIKENIPGIEDMILEEIGEYKQGALEILGKNQIKHSTEDNQEGTSEKEEVASVDEEITKEEVKPEIKEELTETEQSKEEPEIKRELDEESVDEEEVVGDKSPLVSVSEKVTAEQSDIKASGIEQEQIQNEEAILEENKVENDKVEGEELDLTEELDKMAENDNQEEDKK